MNGDVRVPAAYFIGAKLKESVWPANTGFGIDQAWPMLSWGTACPGVNNATYPTFQYSQAVNNKTGDFIMAGLGPYIAVVHNLIDFSLGCFMDNKYGYVATNLPSNWPRPSVVLFYGDADATSGQVTGRFGNGQANWIPEIPVMYIGSSVSFPTINAIFSTLGFNPTGSVPIVSSSSLFGSNASGTLVPSGTNLTGAPYAWFTAGPIPQRTFNMQPIEPSSIAGPLLVGVICLLLGLCNYAVWRYRRMRQGSMTARGFGRSLAELFYYKPPADLTEEEVDVLFPKCDVESSADCPICLSTMALPPPDKVDLDTAKDAITKAAAASGTMLARAATVNDPTLGTSDAVSTSGTAVEATPSEPNLQVQAVPSTVPSTRSQPQQVGASDSSVNPFAESDAASSKIPASEGGTLRPDSTVLDLDTTMPTQPQDDGKVHLRSFPTCSHLFHAECIWNWVASKHRATRFGTAEVRWSCPVCRADHPIWLEGHPEDRRDNAANASGEDVELTEMGGENASAENSSGEQPVDQSVQAPAATLAQGETKPEGGTR